MAAITKMTARRWVVILNNYDDIDIELWDDAINNPKVRYLVYGKEKAPTTGTPHLQGYAEFNQAMRMAGVKKIFGRECHLELAKGTWERNKQYSSKDGDWKEFGEPGPGSGARTDLEEIREVAERGGMRQVTREASSYQQMKAAEMFLKYHEPQRTWKTEVIWIHGETGSGKTRMAAELAGPDAWWAMDGLKWWDGYDGHATCVFDDFRTNWSTMSYLLRVLDRYPMKIEIKGGMRQLLAKLIIITCTAHPADLYADSGVNDVAQLLRRITKIEFCDKVAGNTTPAAAATV